MSRGARMAVSDLPFKYQDQVAAQIYDIPLDCSKPPRPVAQRAPRNGPLAKGKAEARHPGKFVVRVVSYRVRLLDEDNLCPKYHIDGLRYAGLIPSDAPDCTRIITTQEKVRSKDQERTEIVIETLA